MLLLGYVRSALFLGILRKIVRKTKLKKTNPRGHSTCFLNMTGVTPFPDTSELTLMWLEAHGAACHSRPQALGTAHSSLPFLSDVMPSVGRQYCLQPLLTATVLAVYELLSALLDQ